MSMESPDYYTFVPTDKIARALKNITDHEMCLLLVWLDETSDPYSELVEEMEKSWPIERKKGIFKTLGFEEEDANTEES